jgi:hypothetical protein
MDEIEERQEDSVADTPEAEKRPWVTPAVTAEQVSEVTKFTFVGNLADGNSLCSS